MKVWKRILAAVLTLVIAAMPSARVLAASNIEYICDIRIGYGDEGKAALEADGFTVWNDLDANKGGNGGSVWLGYKATEDVNDAITDVAVMNMNGGYSLNAYREELDKLTQNADTLVDQFSTTIDEFRTNYQNGNPYAKTAVETMNCFYDEDFTNADGSYMGVGDLIVDPSTSRETLRTIFLEANTTALTAIEDALALGCTETGDSNVLTRVETAEYPDELDSSTNTARTYLAESFDTFHEEAELVTETYEKIHNAYEESEAQTDEEVEEVEEIGADEGEELSELDQYLQDNADSLTDADVVEITTRYNQYQMLDETYFGEDEEMTLLDFAMLDTSTVNNDGEVLTDEYLEMFAQSLTDGQVGLIPTAGIMTVLTDAEVGDSYDETAMAAVEETASTVERVSVFCGVDRDLFENPNGVALTSDALRENASGSSEFGMTSENVTKAALITAAAGVSMVGTGIAMACAVHYSDAAYEAIHGASNLVVKDLATGAVKEAETVGTVSLKKALSSGAMAAEASQTIAAFCTFIGLFITFCMLLYTIYGWVNATSNKEIIYTEIPRAIVELRDDDRSFVAYYAAKLITASDGETDSLKAYGDLNAQNKQDEWLALYYTKDTDMGTPITTDMLVRSSADASINTEQYTAIHKFGEAAAANLNEYNTGSGKANVYVYLRTVTNAAQTGSVFTTGTVLTGVLSFLVGGGIATAATYLVMKKKKGSTEAAV